MDEKKLAAVRVTEIAPHKIKSTYPEPFSSRMAGREKRRLGDYFGLTNFGVNLTRLEPGAFSALRHAHSRQDEFIYVMKGQPTLYTDDGPQQLAPGMCIGFKAGGDNPNHLVNESEVDAVYLEIGDRTTGDEVRYPDDDIQAVMADGKWLFSHKDGTPY